MKPFRIQVDGYCGAGIERWQKNAQANSHWPRIQSCARHSRRLAIVGGGPLLVHDLPELRAWEGDIWAINDVSRMLTDQGIRCTLFTVDADQLTGEAQDAILATCCDPSLFEKFAGRVRCFDTVETHSEGLVGGCFSSTRAPAVALQLGYADVSFFGCEGSFEIGGHDHAYDSEARPHQMIILAGGKEYCTLPPFLIQCQELANLFVFDGVFHNRSGGLLKAVIENPDTWEVVAVSAALKEHLERNGPTGMYDQPYTGQKAA